MLQSEWAFQRHEWIVAITYLDDIQTKMRRPNRKRIPFHKNVQRVSVACFGVLDSCLKNIPVEGHIKFEKGNGDSSTGIQNPLCFPPCVRLDIASFFQCG